MANTREKLIELLMESGEVCFTQSGEELADHLIANGVTVQEWITVSEPPRKTGIYQVYGYDKDWERTKVWYGQFSGYDWFVYDIYGNGMRFDVTHWMPLPKPPKGE